MLSPSPWPGFFWSSTLRESHSSSSLYWPSSLKTVRRTHCGVCRKTLMASSCVATRRSTPLTWEENGWHQIRALVRRASDGGDFTSRIWSPAHRRPSLDAAPSSYTSWIIIVPWTDKHRSYECVLPSLSTRSVLVVFNVCLLCASNFKSIFKKKKKLKWLKDSFMIMFLNMLK